MTKYVNVLLFILLGLTSPVNLQDVIEASGEPEPNETSTPYSLIDPESSGDGIGDIGSNGEKVDIVVDHIPFDNETLTLIVHNGDLGSRNESFPLGDLDTTTLSGEMPETSSEIGGIEATTLESTTSMLTTVASSATTTDVPLETTYMETTTETTTAEQTTIPKTESTTTRTSTIRGPTTRRTTIPKLWKTTTKPPVAASTVSSTTPKDQEVHACTFVEEDFVCDMEIVCFGDGVVDCIDVEDEIEITTLDPQQISIDSEDYEEENAELYTDYGILTGKLHSMESPSLLWKIHSMSTASPDSATTVNMRIQSTTAVAASSTSAGMTSTHTDPAMTASDTTAMSDSNQMTTTTAEAVTSSDITTEPSSTGIDIGALDKSQDSENSDTTANPLQMTPPSMEGINGENVGENSFVAEMSLDHADLHPAAPEMTTTLPGQRSARKKRNDKMKTHQKADSLRRSESVLSSKPSKSTNVVKRCKIIGNLQCKPFPLTSFCRGRAACKVPVGKTEKSTSEKVESWAIIVIAICATAAALTVSLLIYLVISSWKKLKVQPQNGVTTLAYVNSTPP